MNSITDYQGNSYEYNPANGLISKNGVIVSGVDYEPVFSNYPDNTAPPFFVGILLKRTNTVLSMSGKISRIVDSRQL